VVDTVLFSLSILRSLKGNNGKVWRVLPSQLYMFEVTYDPEDPVKSLDCEHKNVFCFLKLLPSILCASPLESMDNKGIAKFLVKP